MRLGIMQPYFLPQLAYFDLINQAGHFILFDTVQYIRHGYVNRNKIQHPKEGCTYIMVPLVKHSRETLIKDVVIDDSRDWRQRIIGQMGHYRKAPYYKAVIGLLEDALDAGTDSLAILNERCLQKVCDYLEIPHSITRYSLYDQEKLFDVDAIQGPGDWALEISKAMGASEYLNGPGGKDLFDKGKFDEAGIKLTILDRPQLQYSCGKYQWEPRLSIVDVIMWNSPETIKTYLDSSLS